MVRRLLHKFFGRHVWVTSLLYDGYFCIYSDCDAFLSFADAYEKGVYAIADNGEVLPYE